MRHYRSKKYQDNPLKPKLLTKRLEELQELRISHQFIEELKIDLSGPNVDPVNAIYVLEWWKARLSLLLLLETPEDSKLYPRLVENLQRYSTKYKLSAYDIALDGELQMDYWSDLQHFIQMSGTNPYFRAEWPTLHKVVAEIPTRQYSSEKERVVWLGQIVKTDIQLSGRYHGYPENEPAIKILRGAYMGDPVRAGEHTELPKKAIIFMEETSRPSDVIQFLKDAEENLHTSTYFIPEYHEPFLIFPDGKVWTVIGSEDSENEKKSLGDCATGEYTDSSIIVISLREPVMSSPQGTYYRTRLRAEIVFPQGIPGKPPYDVFSKSVGVINQLRGFANSKPKASMHKYIVPLLEQPWVAHLVRPNYRPDEIFWPTDLSPEDRLFLQGKNPQLFDAQTFYDQVKNLNFPYRLQEKILEGIEFPTSYIIQLLSEVATEEFNYSSHSAKGGIVTRALKRRLVEKLPDPELQQLLNAAEESLFRLKSASVATQYHAAGFELSKARIKQILESEKQILEEPSPEEQSPEGRPKDLVEGWRTHPLLHLACESLQAKITRKEAGLEPIEERVRQLLLELTTKPVFGGYAGHSNRRVESWPPNNETRWLLETGVSLRVDQILTILEEYIDYVQKRATLNEPLAEEQKITRAVVKYRMELALSSLSSRVSDSNAIDLLAPILEKIVLDPRVSFKRVQQILKTDAVELSEDKICKLLKEKDLKPGRTLTALVSLKAHLDAEKGATRQISPTTLRIANQAVFRIKDSHVIDEILPWMKQIIPVRGVVKVLMESKVNQVIRNTAIKTIQQKINSGDSHIRNQVFYAVKSLLLRTRDKNFIRQLIGIYDGHQDQYRLFHQFLKGQLEWATQDRNRKFLLNLIEQSLPKSQASGRYREKSLPKSLYQFLRKLVVSNLIEDNCSFLVKILFDVTFDDVSLRNLRALLEVILDAILKDPQKLTRELCSWYQDSPVGWGRTEHKSFSNKIPLSPKLLRQFIGLLNVTQKTGNDCYLDLAVTIAQRMSGDDQAKLQKLTMALVKGAYASAGRVNYKEYLSKLVPRRLKRRKRN